MRILKGKKVAGRILNDIECNIKRDKLKPELAVILVGENKASEIYVKLKGKAAKKTGIDFSLFKFKKTEKENEIIRKIQELNENKKICGIIVQLPLPVKFNTQKIINSINLSKDVDGFHPKNVKKFIKNEADIWPVFPHAIVRLIKSSGVKVKNKKAVILANSMRFGEVMKAALNNKGMKAEYILTKNLNRNLKKFNKVDIVVSAVGKPGIIIGEMIKKSAVVIDGGITKKGKKVFGDVDFDSVKNIAGYLTPVPGGVGPVTIACLLENVYLAAKKQSK